MTLTAEDLTNFIGTTEYHSHWLRRFVFTDGIKYIAEQGEAHWLVDAIASHQTRQLLSNPRLREFQIWELKVNADKSATLTCFEDTNIEVLSQSIHFTDFSLESLKLYLSSQVLMLASEY